jgi:DNA processing protein
MQPAELVSWLSLQAIEGIGDRTLVKLVQSFGSADAVRLAAAQELTRVGCSPDLAERVRRGPNDAVRRTIDRQVATILRTHVRVLSIFDSDYPERLRNIADPPALLYATGTALTPDEVAIAIVGGRRATAAGRVVTEEIARDLAASGVAVVSGLARGIDAAAHRGALAGKGSTVAVLGCGIDRTYPPEHDRLRRSIEAHGTVLSELPIGAPPQSHHFPRRNRIISGLAWGVLVAEAAADSGSLITAKLALEQGREVFALPGPVKEAACRGSNGLLKDGARLVEGAQDIIDDILPQLDARMRARLAPARGASRGGPPSGKEEVLIYEALSYEAQSVDAVIEHTGLTAAQVASTLLALELNGHVRQLPGQQYIRA